MARTTAQQDHDRMMVAECHCPDCPKHSPKAKANVASGWARLRHVHIARRMMRTPAQIVAQAEAARRAQEEREANWARDDPRNPDNYFTQEQLAERWGCTVGTLSTLAGWGYMPNHHGAAHYPRTVITEWERDHKTPGKLPTPRERGFYELAELRKRWEGLGEKYHTRVFERYWEFEHDKNETYVERSRVSTGTAPMRITIIEGNRISYASAHNKEMELLRRLNVHHTDD